MNILFISHMYPNKYNCYSGIFVHKQVLALKNSYSDYINIKVISPVPYTPMLLALFSKKYKGYRSIPRSEMLDGIEVFYPKVFLLPRNLNFAQSGLMFYLSIRKFVKKLDSSNFKIDIIHSHVALPDGVCAKIFKDKINKPYIITIHGQDMDYTINQSENLKNKVFDAINNSEKTIFVSEKLKKEACRYVNNFEKFIVVHNGINIEDLADDTNEIKKQYKGKRMLLSVGNLIETKGHDLTIKAFAEINKKYDNFILIIIGIGSKEEELKKLSRKLGVSDKVIFKGQLPNHEVMRYLKECEMFILPSWKEGFGITYIEAMANGKCAIACKGEGISEVITSGINGILVEPKNLDSLIQNLETLINDKALTKSIGENAAKNIKDKFTWKHNAEIMMKVYTEVIEKCH